MNAKRLMALLIAVMMVICMVPASAFAATKSETITIVKGGEPDDDEGDYWEIRDDGKHGFKDEYIYLASGCTFKFSGSYTCSMDVYNEGTISSGKISGDVYNEDGAKISGGTYSGAVFNYGTISGGTFKEDVENYGTISGGTFATWLNDDEGLIKGGTFNGKGTNYSKITKGTFKDEVSNLGTITDGTFSCFVTNGHKSDDDYEDATIGGGTFGGDDDEEVINYAIIKKGTFNIPVTNYNTISGGTFNETVYLEDSRYYEIEISGGAFSEIENNSDEYDLDDADCTFGIQKEVRGSGEIFLTPSNAVEGQKVQLQLQAKNSATLSSVVVYDGDDDSIYLTEVIQDSLYSFYMPEGRARVVATFSDWNGSNSSSSTEKISAVKLFCSEPEAGEELPDIKTVQKSSDTAPGYTVKWVWLDEDDDEFDDEAESGEEYTAKMTVKSKSGYSFATSPTVTLNGSKCTISTSNSSSIVAYYTFDELEDEDIITNVKLFCDELELEEELPEIVEKENSKDKDPKYEIQYYTWYDDDDDELDDDEEVEEDIKYTVEVVIYPADDDYEFTTSKSNISVTLNGQKCTVTTLKASRLVCEYTFDEVTDDVAITSVKLTADDIKVGSKLPSAEAGGTSPKFTVKTAWTDSKGKSFTGNAVAGAEYTMKATLTPKSGYKFTTKTTATVNGSKATVDSASTSKLVVVYTFTAPKAADHTHDYSGKYNSTQHWKECSVCQDKIEVANHTFGNDGKCIVCGCYNASYDKLKDQIPFTDVKSTDVYYAAVNWAYTAKPQITDGTSKTTFSPNSTCTRAQVLTFLWRACGQPEPKSTKNPFTDVKSTDYFYKPVLWAVEKKITDGTSATKFTPDGTCTYAHILTFIYRAMGEPDKDPNLTEWYDNAYFWAKTNKLLDGTYTGTFPLTKNCPRGYAIQYLYKYYNMKK